MLPPVRHSEPRSAIRIEDCEGVYVGDNLSVGFDVGVDVARTKNFRGERNINITLKKTQDHQDRP